MEHDLKRYPRLLAKLLTGSPLPLDCSIQGCISVWDLTHLGLLTGLEQEKLGWMVDVIARSSAQAQGLRGPITSLQKLQRAGQTLYLAAERTVADRWPTQQTCRRILLLWDASTADDARQPLVRLVGLLKTGRKSLFLRDAGRAYCSAQPLCVLDFFVLRQHQRQGLGQALFQVFQATEQESPGSVAYDTPSPKLLSFLQKHYGLGDCLPQDNRFVVFNTFWQFHSSSNAEQRGVSPSSQWRSVASRALTPPRSRSGLAHLAARPATAAPLLYSYGGL